MAEPESAGQARGERVRRLILETAIDLVFEVGFRSVSVELIAARSGVAKTTIYRRWPNKAAVVMDAFMMRVGSETLFPPAKTVADRVRLQMHAMAKVFTGKDGALVRGCWRRPSSTPSWPRRSASGGRCRGARWPSPCSGRPSSGGS